MGKRGYPRYSKEEVELALRQTNGIMTHAARILGCDRVTVKNYIERYPELAEVKRQVDSDLVNLAETALRKRLRDTINSKAKYPADNLIKFVLRCKAGWVPKQAIEVTGKDGKDLFANLTRAEVALLESHGFEASEMFELFVQEYAARVKEGAVKDDSSRK